MRFFDSLTALGVVLLYGAMKFALAGSKGKLH